MTADITQEVRDRFLVRLAETASVTRAAAATGADKTTFYRHRLRDPAFAHEWRMALLAGYDRIELALIRRALGLADEEDGDDGIVGELDVYLAFKLLTRHRPVVVQAAATIDAEAFRASPDTAATVLLTKLRALATGIGTPAFVLDDPRPAIATAVEA